MHKNVLELKNKTELMSSYWICLGFQAVLDRGLFYSDVTLLHFALVWNMKKVGFFGDISAIKHLASFPIKTEDSTNTVICFFQV